MDMSDGQHRKEKMTILQLEQLGYELRKMKGIKGVVGLTIARNLRMIDDELKEYYEVKNQLFQKYGETQGDQMIINKMSDNYPKFIEEIAPYESQEVNLDFRKVSEDDLSKSELTAEQMYILLDFMVE